MKNLNEKCIDKTSLNHALEEMSLNDALEEVSLNDTLEEVSLNDDTMEGVGLNDAQEEVYDDDYDFNDEKTYTRYNGSYAQDIEGWSDDDIDIVFEGDPDAYWNID